MKGKRFKEGKIVPNKCETCIHWYDTPMTTTIEGIPSNLSGGVCGKWLGAFMYGYNGASSIKSMCDEYKDVIQHKK